jgi:conjugative transfer signal peptidase TraF
MKITGLLPRTILVSTVVVFVLAGAIRLRGIVLNPSPSAPKGLYARSTDPNFVLFCPDQRWPSFAKNPNFRRNWVPSSACPDGHRAFLKPIAAKPGDTVSVTAHGIVVNGKLIPHSIPLKEDNFGEPLHAYPYGIYRVQPGQLWVISPYSDRSYDSRYYGPIPSNSVLASVRPWLLFSH